MSHKKSRNLHVQRRKKSKNNIKICIEIKRKRILRKENIKASDEGTIPSNSTPDQSTFIVAQCNPKQNQRRS